MICTHNDSDHVNGLLKVLRSNIQIDQLWVPSSFLVFMKKLIDSSVESIVEELEANISKSNKKRLINIIRCTHGLSILDDKYEEICAEYSDKEKDQSDEEHGVPICVEVVEKELVLNEFIRKINYLINNLYNCGLLNLVEPKIKDVLNLSELILSAKEKKQTKPVKIRYFEHQKNTGKINHDGDPDFLFCLSANEVFNIRKYTGLLTNIIHLTQVNRHSLVFYHPENHPDKAAVLLSSDSNLAKIRPPNVIPKKIVTTAPHHGSTENENAFIKINRIFSKSTKIWVRSDNSNVNRPAAWYIQKKNQPRYCTNCNDRLTRNCVIEIDKFGNVNGSPILCVCS